MLLQVNGAAEVPQIEQRVSTGWMHANQRTSKSAHVCTATAAMAIVEQQQQQWWHGSTSAGNQQTR